MSKFYSVVAFTIWAGLSVSTHGWASSQRCEATLSNTKISFNRINGRIDEKSVFFASPINPSKNLAGALELRVTPEEGGSSNEKTMTLKLSINTENYKAAEDEGFSFPSLGSCDCQEMPENFDYDTYELFLHGNTKLRFQCTDAMLI